MYIIIEINERRMDIFDISNVGLVSTMVDVLRNRSETTTFVLHQNGRADVEERERERDKA